MSRLAYANMAVSMRETNPDFLVIGAARSATGWLFKRLSAHPAIFVPRGKEVHFFDAQKNDGSYVFNLKSPGHWRWYWMHFRKAGDRTCGDMTPKYAILPEPRVAEIASHLPDKRIIYSIRDPIDRAWSGLRHRLWHGKGLKADQLGEDDLIGRIMHPEILAKGDHRSVIEKWEKYYGSDNFKCIFYDDVINSPGELLDGLYRFLAVDPAMAPEDSEKIKQRVNAVPGAGIPAGVREILSEYYGEQIPYLEDKFNRRLDGWIGR